MLDIGGGYPGDRAGYEELPGRGLQHEPDKCSVFTRGQQISVSHPKLPKFGIKLSGASCCREPAPGKLTEGARIPHAF